ncbi:hypothetical protein BHE74_00037441 [Ensete ventricosum]|nr:hypothetical protein BHE74_00037441 [Ensete ventricosum]
MKPRDPRRILHNNMVQKNEVVASEQNNINGATAGPQGSMGHLTAREAGEQAQANILPTQFSPLPDRSEELTKNLPTVVSSLQASKLYELHLYTMGNKLYATEMAKVLDPTGSLFSGRVISRGDDGDTLNADERVPKSKDLDGVLGMESAVVIIDDSVRVWPHNKLNLIVVERFGQ